MLPENTLDHIDHSAIVESVEPSKNIIKVKIDDSDECGECPAAKLCEASGQGSNIVTIATPHASGFKIGDIITIRGTEQMHRKAVMYATVLPCIALIAVMAGVYLLTFNQLAAALSGIGVTIIFFILLWSAKNKIAHEFSFTIVGKPQRAGHEK